MTGISAVEVCRPDEDCNNQSKWSLHGIQKSENGRHLPPRSKIGNHYTKRVIKQMLAHRIKSDIHKKCLPIGCDRGTGHFHPSRTRVPASPRRYQSNERHIEKWFTTVLKSKEFYARHAEARPRRYFYNVDLQGRLFLGRSVVALST